VRFEPLANRIIIAPIEESKVTPGGLVIPDVATRNKQVAFGTVLAVGPGRNTADGGLIPCHVKVGDVVLFPRQAPAVLPLIDNDGEETKVLMCAENDVIAIVHDLPRATGLTDINGAHITLSPSSLALPDSVYENREGIERAISDLRQSQAPQDVIDEVANDHDDGLIEH
jgi:chaperonin GroES